MKQKHLVWPILLAMSLMLACRSPRHEAAIKANIALAEDQPDSALAQLKRMDKRTFTFQDSALYGLAYSKAQYKSGTDIKDDSLLRKSYQYFSKLPHDSLYGVCMFYMGCYYAEVDSMDQAVYCLHKAADASEALKDTAFLCLSYERLACYLRVPKTEEAIVFSKRALDLYSIYQHAKVDNLIYYGMEYAGCLIMDGKFERAFMETEKYLDMAIAHGDSTVISDVYQQLGYISNRLGHIEQQVFYIRHAFRYGKNPNLSLILNLAVAYKNAGKYKECKQVLDTVRITTHTRGYDVYYILFDMALRQKDYKMAKSYADTAFWHCEQRYYQSCQEKEAYFKEKVSQNEARQAALYEVKEYRSRQLFIALFAIFLITLAALYVYHYKQSTRMRLNHSAEIAAGNEERIKLMREYLMQKSEIIHDLQKLNSANANHYVLKTQEWEELETLLNCAQDQIVNKMRKAHQLLSEEDIHLMILLRLDLPSKSLATIYGISEQSIRQKLYMFKSKVGLPNEGPSLREYVRGL